jgi:hypothetical protein
MRMVDTPDPAPRMIDPPPEDGPGAGATIKATDAALDLQLLQRAPTYDQLAELLATGRADARRRVRRAVEKVVGDRTPPPPLEMRGQIVDYLLGEQTMPQRMQTRSALDRSAGARAWAQEARLSLALVMQAALPAIPDPHTELNAHEADGEPPVLQLAGDHARNRGAIVPGRTYLVRRLVALGSLLAVIAIALVVALVLDGGGASKPSPLEHLRLTATGAQPHATGVAAIVHRGSTSVLLLQGRGLRPNHGDSYGVWLENTEQDAELLGLITPPVGRSGRFSSGTSLPDDAVRFHRLVITRETTQTPSRPGQPVLSSTLSVG